MTTSNVELVIYLPAGTETTDRLAVALEQGDLRANLVCCRTIIRLARRLRHSGPEAGVYLVAAVDREELDRLSAIRALLWGARSILLLPDRDEDTVALGLDLRPRFIGYLDEDFNNVVHVLHRMLRAANGAEMIGAV